jgi:hypothetical protein
LIPNWGSNIHYNIKQTLLHPPKIADSGMASRTFQIFQFTDAILVVVVFEVDKKKETFPVTGKMHVEVPADVTPEELKQIESVLKETIAKSLGCNPEQMKVTIDPETGEAIFVMKTNDPHLAEDMHKKLSHKDFATNVNTGISENSKHLPEKIREVLEIHTVNVNYSLFSDTIH